MNGLIIYKGKYGATGQYARWIAEETNLEHLPSSAMNGTRLDDYDFYIFGSSVYIGQIQLKKWLKKNLQYIRGKKIFFFQVAGTPPGEIETRQSYNKNSIPEELMANCEFYYFPGKMRMKDLSWADRFMLKMGAR